MAMFRQIRKRHKITVDGPATITVASGQASVHIEAGQTVKIEHVKPKTVHRGLTRTPKRR